MRCLNKCYKIKYNLNSLFADNRKNVNTDQHVEQQDIGRHLQHALATAPSACRLKSIFIESNKWIPNCKLPINYLIVLHVFRIKYRAISR